MTAAEQWVTEQEARLKDSMASAIGQEIALEEAVAAIKAVQELHEISCEGCDDGPECRTCWEAWPCDTYTAIETALAGDPS